MRAPLASTRPDELFDDAWIEDPHPHLSRIREANPISRVGETGVHLVSSWALVDEALGREDDFSANLTGVLIRGEDGLPSTFELGQMGANQVIATADEPAHAIHRALSQPRLAPARIAELEAPLRRWTDEALTPWIEKGGGDFVPIAELIPARAVARILGLPDGDVSYFRKWAMMGGDMLAGDVTPASMSALGLETGRMAEYLGEHFDAAARQPQPDVDAPLLHALADGVRDGAIERQEAIGIAIVMFGAGGESTAALIGSAMRVLSTREELADRLRRDPSLIPRFVEEVVRLEPPFKFHYRAVRRACELGGHALEPGDRLMLMWAAANRDPAVFEEPNVLRLDRRHPKRHMSFGRGAHFCIGAPLARLETRVILEAALARTRRIAPSPDAKPEYARSIFIRRLERLPIVLEPAPESPGG